jgi:hypothetical protein
MELSRRTLGRLGTSSEADIFVGSVNWLISEEKLVCLWRKRNFGVIYFYRVGKDGVQAEYFVLVEMIAAAQGPNRGD